MPHWGARVFFEVGSLHLRWLELQAQRRELDSESADAVDIFLAKLDACILAERDFTVILDDAAGELVLLVLGSPCQAEGHERHVKSPTAHLPELRCKYEVPVPSLNSQECKPER